MNRSVMVILMLAIAGCADEKLPQAGAESAEVSQAGPAGPIDASIAQCTFTAEASIYNVKASQWRAEYYGSGDVRSLNLTVWRPAAGGPDQINLVVSKAGQQYRINTVQGSDNAGSGEVTIEEDTDGGARFVIDGKDQYGNPLHATVSCGQFMEPLPAGG